MSETVPTWGYHPTKEPQIFHLKPGEKLPAGWADTPVAFDAPQPTAKPKAGKGK